jgi:DNA-binding MarR family transcriptional regulator
LGFAGNPVLGTASYQLTSLHKAHRAALEPRLAALDLAYGAELLLAELWRERPLAQAELASRLAVKPPSVTKVVRRLERQGIVRRERDPVDARVSLVDLTGRGAALERDVARAWREAERETLAALSREEVGSLRALLTKALHGQRRR